MSHKQIFQNVPISNELLTFREGLNQERQQRIDEAHAQATRAILHEALF
jgi:hypothetical protein